MATEAKTTYHHNPHDLFFKEVMANKQVAEDYFKALLPKKIKEKIAWDTLQIADPTLIGDKSQQLSTDITYQCKTKDKKVTLYLHAEQIRSINKNDDIKILAKNEQYASGRTMQHIEQGNNEFPFIYNLLLYNGTNKTYTLNQKISDYCADPDLIAKDIYILKSLFYFLW